MVADFYSILMIISIINLFALIYIGRKQNISVYIMLYIAITINLIGHNIISKSMYFETALEGHRLVYIGAVFCPILWLFGVAKLCKIKITKYFTGGLIAYSITVLYLAYNVGTQKLYFEHYVRKK